MNQDQPLAQPDSESVPETVLTHFERWVARQPQAVALIDEHGPWTYAALAARVDTLASRLQAAGVVPEQPVAVLMQRRADLLAVLLGLWKAGAAYVPFDPQEPPERLLRMLVTCGCTCVMGDASLLERLRAACVAAGLAPPLCLDVAQPDAVPSLPPPLPCVADGARLAYLLFTSGSTGAPKAVEVEHRHVLALLDSARELLGYTPQDRTLAASTIAFDASVTEFFLPLTSGASLLLRDRTLLVDPRRLAHEVREHGVTVVATGPSVWSVVLAEVPDFPRVRVLITHGEAVLPALARRLCAFGEQVWNLYGPTETTVWATGHALSADQDGQDRPASAPIGRPLAHVLAMVVDDQGRRLADGCEGELCLGGPAVARGYRGDDALTRERFVLIDGQRVYRTGDLVVREPDGVLHYLGRNDDQMKVRGVRVEPGEVEAALARDPRVSQAAVTWYPTSTGTRSIAAAVVLKPGLTCRADQLREALSAQLPQQMIPTRYLLVPWLPTTTSGKVDRQAIRRAAAETDAPEPGEKGARHTPAATAGPLSPTEAAVGAIWQRMLGMAAVSGEDHFFAIGGDSLAAVQMMVEAEAVLGLLLPVHLAFEAPTLSALCARIDAQRLRERGNAGGNAGGKARSSGRWQGLRRAGGAIVALTRRRGRASGAERGPAAADDIDAETQRPISLAQRRLWLLDRLLPDRAGYNVHWCWRLRGKLDLPALAWAMNALVARHETLRTRYVLQDAEPVQRIGPPRPLAWPVIELGQLERDAGEAQATALLKALAAEPFNLEAGAPLRLQLLRLADDEYLLQFCVHHIAADGWSLAIFARDLSLAYAAAIQARSPDWPRLPLQYADHARRQREQLAGAVLATQLAYWEQQLAGLPTLALPADKPRPAVASHRGARIKVMLPPGLCAALQQHARQEGATLFMVLLAGFKVLLARYCGQSDMVVGTPVAGRHLPGSEALIGFFINTVVLRTDLAGNPTWRTLLARVRETASGAFAHQELPFEKLVEAIAPNRDLAREPLFQVLFALQNMPTAELVLPGIEVTRTELALDEAKFDLGVFARDSADGLCIDWVYATDLFDAATVQRMAVNFVGLLEAVVADPAQPIDALARPSHSECRLLQQHWGAAAVSLTDGPCLHELVQAQVVRQPQAVALVAGLAEWTYRALDEQASRLAHWLRARGVGPEDRVGVCLDRTADMVVALLAILKAGAAYVPLDPVYPMQRLALMEAQAALALVVTRQALLERLPPPGVQRLCLDTDAAQIARQSADAPSRRSGAASLAYVLFTSGSSGRPKGVAVEHRNAVAMVQWATTAFSPDELAGTLFSTSIGFDLSVFELFVPLCCGGTVILAEDALQWTELPTADRVTLVNTVPSVLQALLRGRRLPRSVRTVNLAGEALPEALLRQLFGLTHVGRVCNLYGPTECTTYATWASLDPADAGPPTIGRPIAGTLAYVLDSQRALVPLGAPGELYLGGAGVARGYLNQPALTEERFIPDPFADAPAARMYRTGDRVRQRADGRLDYLGRLDEQVKIRGFRIEPGEVEAVLGRHPALRQCLVMAQADPSGDQRLVAYGVLAESAEPAGPALQQQLAQHLRQYLPEAWCPTAWVWLEQWPLTLNGKVDRQALPAPRADQGVPVVAPVAPRDALEEKLLQVWREVLDVEVIGIHDNFFDLGGHSLLAVRLFARLDETSDTPLPLAMLFHAPTVAALAEALRDRQPTSGPVPLNKEGSLPPLFAVAPGDGDLMIYRTLAKQLGPDQPFFGLPLDGLVDEAPSPRMIVLLATRQSQALRRLQPHGPYRLIGACFGALVAIELARQLLEADEQVVYLALINPTSPRPEPFDLRVQALPRWLRDGLEFGRFVAARVRSYGQHWRGLGWADRQALLKDKFRVARRIVQSRGGRLASHPEWQSRLQHRASLHALQQHRTTALPPSAPVVDVFCGTARLDGVHNDWNDLLDGKLRLHRVDGQSLAQILREDRAIALAASIAGRLQTLP